MRKAKINYISIAFILCLLVILYFYFFKGLFEGSKYGRAANVIREYVKIPIIESNMRKVRTPNNVEGSRWESKDEENGLVHLWKIVSPYNGIYLLFEELDSFKKYRDKESYWQLNISSKILGDSISSRRGILRLCRNGNTVNMLNLDENGLDSIFTKWELKSLVKGNIPD